jgi:hypothetical protein
MYNVEITVEYWWATTTKNENMKYKTTEHIADIINLRNNINNNNNNNN